MNPLSSQLSGTLFPRKARYWREPIDLAEILDVLRSQDVIEEKAESSNKCVVRGKGVLEARKGFLFIPLSRPPLAIQVYAGIR